LYRKFLNARSPLRLLEKGLHGGLGAGNVGVVLAGHGVGKGSVLVGVALDELLRSGHVLHISMAHTVSHIRAHYDAVFEELASSAHLKDEATVHVDIDRHRHIRVYLPGEVTAAKLREAVGLEKSAGAELNMLIIDGLDFDAARREDVVDIKALAQELGAEIWISAAAPQERVSEIPQPIQNLDDLISVILTLEPAQDTVALRALKDHDNTDLTNLHVALDPRTLLLVRT